MLKVVLSVIQHLIIFRLLALSVLACSLGFGGIAAGTAFAADASHASRWLAMNLLERQRAAEAIGEEGARQFAKANGFKPLYTGHGPKDIPQGLDQVHMGSDGRLKVIEAKGGNASVRQSYGQQQGSSEWAVKASERTLKSPKAGVAQKAAAEKVIDMAAKGKMDVLTVNTPHVLGKPGAPILKNAVATSGDAARMAQQIQKSTLTARAAINAASKSVGSSATIAGKSAQMTTAVVGKTMVKTTAEAVGTSTSVVATTVRALPVFVAAVEAYDLGKQAYDVESDYARGAINGDERVRAHAVNAAKKAGGLTAAWAGVQAGGAVGGAAGGLLGGVGAPIGAVAGGIVGGVAGYFGGECAVDSLFDWVW